MDVEKWFSYNPFGIRANAQRAQTKGASRVQTQPLPEQLDKSLAEQFAEALIDHSRVPRTRKSAIERSVDFGVEDDGSVLRVSTSVTGSTWWEHWNGTRGDAVRIVRQLAIDTAYLLEQEREHHGASPWEV